MDWTGADGRKWLSVRRHVGQPRAPKNKETFAMRGSAVKRSTNNASCGEGCLPFAVGW